MGKLALIPTPIGNREDITLRALRYLKEADVILAEDTRTTKKLLQMHDIKNDVQAFHMHNEHSKLESTIQLIRNSSLVCLASDAGTPGISDPGFLLLRECIDQNIEVECLPGPVAFVPALLLSGFPTESFIFDGFLPHKKGRQTKILAAKDEARTVIWYESPHRLVKLLEQIVELLGPERKVAVAREISKIYEECIRGEAIDVLNHFKEKGVKGEIVVVLERSSKKRNAKSNTN